MLTIALYVLQLSHLRLRWYGRTMAIHFSRDSKGIGQRQHRSRSDGGSQSPVNKGDASLH